MLRIHTNSSPAVAKTYFSSADYYSEGQELVGVWRGKGAARLGLFGEVKQQDWDRLCDNQHPETGRSLTPRQKAQRRVGYDFTFDVPKSVSLLYGLTRDERILEAFEASADETMREVEADSQARVRKGGKDEDRTTGNLVWGRYVHFTSRPVDGVPDPQLHAHCFVFNCTFDPHEERWKAVQVGDIKRDAPYFQATFDAIFTRKLADLGVAVERHAKGWELPGLDKSTLDRFSRRTSQIETIAKAKGITDPTQKAALGATIREKKAKHLSMGELEGLWRQRLTDSESGTIEAQRRSIGGPVITERESVARDSVAHAADHCLEQSSVIPERRVLAEALRHGVGLASPMSIRRAFDRFGFINAERDGQRLVTTREVLAEEQKMIGFARSGRGSSTPLGGSTSISHVFKRDWLNADQRHAVEHVLTSRDRVMVIRGAAGVGKTSMMQEAVEAIKTSGHDVSVLAPSAEASRRTLREKQFELADTVARFLKDQAMQGTAQDQVIWIDEAGLLGTRTTAKVFELADQLNARVILSGDRRQHGSVERGAALRLLEEEAGLIAAEIKEIQRQKGDYKQLVQWLSEGRTEQGFNALDKLGWIKELPGDERYARMAKDYVQALKAEKSALVISPTHAEGARITGEIRSALRASKRLGKDERTVPILDKIDLTQAQRSDAVNFHAGDVLVFHQHAKGYRKAQKVPVASLDRTQLPLDQAERFQVFRSGTLRIAPGDLVRITHNGQTADRKHALNNGSVYKVKGFNEKGDLVLDNGWTVAKDSGHLTHGYVVTSHASQGRDVQRVFVGQSAQSFPASSREQFYVSVSRGTEKVTVYTDDKRDLLEAVKRSDERLSATELVADATKAQPTRAMPEQSRANTHHRPPSRSLRDRMRPVLAAWARSRDAQSPSPSRSSPDRHQSREREIERG